MPVGRSNYEIQKAFQESKALMISRIPSKDLRKKLRKECKMEGYRFWFYVWKEEGYKKLKERKAERLLRIKNP